MTSNKPFIVSIVSGKGGVGKTRISLTLAKVLSNSLRVLLIDFDLHNQGLTHLLFENKRKNADYSQLFLGQIAEVFNLEQNLQFLPAISYKGGESQKNIEKLNHEFTAKDFSTQLSQIIGKFSEIDCVIIDNTGIPDDFSIGSSLVADKVLLITQTDNVTWKGALNFHRIFQNNGGNPLDVDFIINNIPKKYSYELLDFEVNKIGEFLRNLNFKLFLPFEYGVFEGFDEKSFEDEELKKSQFYRKIELLSVDLLKEFNMEEFISDDLKTIDENYDGIKKSLDVKLDRSGDKLLQKKRSLLRVFKLIFSAMFLSMAIMITSVTHPQLIPSFIRDIDFNSLFNRLIIIALIFSSILFLVMDVDKFDKFIESMRK